MNASPNPTPASPPIERLLMVVIQEEDVDRTLRAIKKLDLTVTRLPSTGGFLGQHNTTLLLGLSVRQEQQLKKALHKSCHARTEYVDMPVEGTPLHLPASTPIIIGGATLFSFEVERFEEF